MLTLTPEGARQRNGATGALLRAGAVGVRVPGGAVAIGKQSLQSSGRAGSTKNVGPPFPTLGSPPGVPFRPKPSGSQRVREPW